jgi:hypothetical protein
MNWKIMSRRPAESASEQQCRTVSASVFCFYIFVVARHLRAQLRGIAERRSRLNEGEPT